MSPLARNARRASLVCLALSFVVAASLLVLPPAAAAPKVKLTMFI